ncbi:MAG: hypothetical protein Rhims3KO_23710 [Hyphomicrobiales bacterium]
MSDVTLSSAVRSNLISLQNTADLMSKTQERLATGQKVNSALDNPTNFFTASALNGRASDLASLLDGVSNATQTLQAADNGITAITKLVESAQATVRQAQQTSATVDQTTAATAGSVDAGAFSAVNVSGTGSAAEAATLASSGNFTSVDVSGGDKSFTIDTGSGATTVNLTQAASGGNNSYDVSEIQTQVDAALGAGVVTVGGGGGSDPISFTTVATGASQNITIAGTDVADLGITSGATDAGADVVAADSLSFSVAVDGGTAETVTIDAAAVTAYNSANSTTFNSSALTAANVAALVNDQVTGTVATVDGTSGNLTLASGTTGASSSVAITGFTASVTGGSTGIANATDTGSATSTTEVVNTKRAEFIGQYNEIVGQINELAEDSGFNGVNLLDGDNLAVTFNEDGSSTLDITGVTFDAAGLGLSALGSTAFDTDTSINSTLSSLESAIGSLRSQASEFGSNLSIVETREDFTKSTINTLETGAANLTLADTNEEGANLLALQTRQQLSTTALSMASQADQNVLRLL